MSVPLRPQAGGAVLALSQGRPQTPPCSHGELDFPFQLNFVGAEGQVLGSSDPFPPHARSCSWLDLGLCVIIGFSLDGDTDLGGIQFLPNRDLRPDCSGVIGLFTMVFGPGGPSLNCCHFNNLHSSVVMLFCFLDRRMAVCWRVEGPGLAGVLWSLIP